MSWLIRKMPSAFLLQLGDELVDLGGLGRAEGGGRLVHDQDAGVEVDGAGDRHRLALPAGQPPDGGLEVGEPRVEAAHHAPRRRRHRRVVEGTGASEDLPAEEHVGGGVDIVGQRQRLVDRLDAERPGVTGVADRAGVTVDENLAGVGRMRTGQRPHQRRLACAVPTHEGDDLAGVDVDVDVVDGMHAAERHADIAHLDKWHRPPVRRVGPDRVRLVDARHRPTSQLDRRRIHESRPTATMSTIPT